MDRENSAVESDMAKGRGRITARGDWMGRTSAVDGVKPMRVKTGTVTIIMYWGGTNQAVGTADSAKGLLELGIRRPW